MASGLLIVEWAVAQVHHWQSWGTAWLRFRLHCQDLSCSVAGAPFYAWRRESFEVGTVTDIPRKPAKHPVVPSATCSLHLPVQIA